jgi:hypothetical protein
MTASAGQEHSAPGHRAILPEPVLDAQACICAAARASAFTIPAPTPGTDPQGACMTYLIVGLDRNTFAPWHRNVLAGDVTTAVRLGCARAAAQGVQLVVAAVIGPNSSVIATVAPAESLAA